MIEHDDNFDKSILPKHEFFKCGRWQVLFRCDSYYFDGDTHSTLRYDEIGGAYVLTVRSNLKNYDSEIDKFIDWITQYVRSGYDKFLGYYRYEEFDDPTLLYLVGGKIEQYAVNKDLEKVIKY